MSEKNSNQKVSLFSIRSLAAAAITLASCWLLWTFYQARLESDRQAEIRNRAAVPSSGHSLFSPKPPQRLTAVDRMAQRANPRNDQWDTEIANQEINRALVELGSRIKKFAQAQGDAAAMDNAPGNHASIKKAVSGERVISADFSAVTYSTSQLVRISIAPDISVERSELQTKPASRHATVEDLCASLLPNRSSTHVEHCKFKVTGIEAVANGFQTTVLMELLARNSNSDPTPIQTTANWVFDWRRKLSEPAVELGSQPSSNQSTHQVEIVKMVCTSFERVTLANHGRSLFDDVTISALGNTNAFQQQVMYGVEYWSQRQTGIDDMHMFGHHGIAVGDVNGDLLDDIYVCDSGGLPNRLYLQKSDGTLEDVSARSGVDWLESTASALLVDLDNDGDQDLVVSTVAGVLYAENDGQAKFKIRGAYTQASDPHSICAADYDSDGDVDLFLCNYGPGESESGARGFEGSAPIPYNDANNGGANVLLKNAGNFQFTDVTAEAGLENNRRFTFAAAWEDYDLDGDMDLYVANDFGRNNLYQNNGGHFRDVAASAGVEDMAGGMSVDWADVNRDGKPDVYIGNMYSAAGNRVTYQRKFTDNRMPTQASGIQRMARGNSLFVANADGSFVDASEPANVTMGRWAWSSKLSDLNNDGWTDIVIANGYFTNQKADDL